MPNKMRRACGLGALAARGLLLIRASPLRKARRLRRHAQDQYRRSRCRRRTSCTPSPYVAKELGIFAKHCIDATIILRWRRLAGLEGRGFRKALRSSLSAASPSATGREVKQIWGLAPRMPQAYGRLARDQDCRGPQRQRRAPLAAASAASTGSWAARP